MSEWYPVSIAPRDRFILLFSPDEPDWAGNMEVGRWYGGDDDGCFWSCGDPNGGLELKGNWTHWTELPAPPATR